MATPIPQPPERYSKLMAKTPAPTDLAQDDLYDNLSPEIALVKPDVAVIGKESEWARVGPLWTPAIEEPPPATLTRTLRQE